MPFGDQLAGGLGFMSNFPTPAAGGLAAAAQVIGSLSGPAEAQGINPYADYWRLFEPGGELWGAPLTNRDLTGGSSPPGALKWAPPPRPSGVLNTGQTQRDAIFKWLLVARRSWSMPADGTRCFGEVFAPGDVKYPRFAGVLRVSVLNALFAEYRARQAEMVASTEPTFHYIDLRAWGDAEIEYWARDAPTLSPTKWRALKGPRPITEGMSYAQRHVYELSDHAKVRKYHAEAKAEHEQMLEQNRAWYQDEKARWTEWKRALAREAAVAEQGAALEQAIHDYVANAADPDQALQDVANGQVRFALGQSDNALVRAHGGGGGGLTIAGGAPGAPAVRSPAESENGGIWLALAAAAGLALLIGAAE